MIAKLKQAMAEALKSCKTYAKSFEKTLLKSYKIQVIFRFDNAVLSMYNHARSDRLDKF